MTDVIAYYRVSTKEQGESGLGLAAQKTTVESIIERKEWCLIGEYTEIESGAKNNRRKLNEALERCRETGATLVVAKVDRLARNSAFLMSIVDSGQPVFFCDMQEIDGSPASRFMLQMLASAAEFERNLISQRVKAALAEAKKRGVKLGGWRGGPPPKPNGIEKLNADRADEFARKIGPYIDYQRGKGATIKDVCKWLENNKILTFHGNKKWHSQQVTRIHKRYNNLEGI